MNWKDEPCSFEGCNRPLHVKKARLCNTHSQQLHRGQPLTPIKPVEQYPPDAVCKEEGCTTEVFSKWLCKHHYYMLRYHGTLEEVRMKKDERRCTTCKTVAHWTQFARIDGGTRGLTKKECMTCYRLRINPPKDRGKELTAEELLRILSIGNDDDETRV